MELRAFVPQDQIGRLRLGSDARIRIDAFPERTFDAEVTRIDERAQFTPREVYVPEERVRLMFGVTLSASNPDGLLKPGMPADAWIRWDPEVAWPDRLHVPR
jgi:HlyD family secretion protein